MRIQIDGAVVVLFALAALTLALALNGQVAFGCIVLLLIADVILTMGGAPTPPRAG